LCHLLQHFKHFIHNMQLLVERCGYCL